jgi:putative thioredoxin
MEENMNNLSNTPSIKDTSDEAFMVDVVEASKNLPILVDFWAPWCGPCKTLGPALESAVIANQNKINLVKINIDKNPRIASQLRVQSIPAVFAFSNGQPVDGFMGMQTPSQITDFINKIIDGFGPKDSGLDEALTHANELLERQNFSEAIEIFKTIIKEDTTVPEAHVGLIRGFLGNKEIEKATLTYEEIPKNLLEKQIIKSAFSQIQLAKQSVKAGKSNDLRKKLLQTPKDLHLKFDLALALIAEEQTHEAIETLLEIIQKKLDWEDNKAKNQLIELLDALGPEDHLGRTGRRRLSSLLFY